MGSGKERVTPIVHKRVQAIHSLPLPTPPKPPSSSSSPPRPPPHHTSKPFFPPTMLRSEPIILLLLLFPFSSPSFAPPDHHLLNCGSPDPATLHARLFLPDDAASPAGSISLSLPSQHPLYSTARIFTRPSSYRLNLRSKGTHFLRLHFSPFTFPRFNSSAAAFSVSALGYTLLYNFTPPPAAAVVKEFLLNVRDEDEVIRISFTPASCMPASFAFVNAVEVFSAPAALVWDIARSPSPGAAGRARYVDGVAKQGFETVHRLNVGGPRLTPFNDTLWRSWEPDEYPTASSSAATKVVSFSGRIQYRRGGSTREVAPDSVYRTAVELSSPSADSKMTWVLPVGLGHRYLVRLHLCDIVSLAVNQLYFSVYVNGGLAYEDLDLSGVDFSNQLLASPHYVDFVVEPMVVSGASGAVSVSLGPSKLSEAGNMNAILNGLEVFKMNDSAGSFNAEARVGAEAGSMHGRKVSAWLCSVLGGIGFMSLLVGGLLMLSKKRLGFKDAFAWSPLPVDVEANLKDGSSPLSGKLVCY